MTAEECNARAGACAANAALAASETVALEFIRMAAQWRSMATHTINLGPIDDVPLVPTFAGPPRLPIR